MFNVQNKSIDREEKINSTKNLNMKVTVSRLGECRGVEGNVEIPIFLSCLSQSEETLPNIDQYRNSTLSRAIKLIIRKDENGAGRKGIGRLRMS